jgi:serine/threonine protein kinase
MSDTPNARPGAAAPTEDGSDALPIGARLADFEIRQVIGSGGFGIVYRAWDEALQRDVALKEYMPVSLAGRGASERVTLRSRTNEETFALGLQSFVNEARLLARFDHPALVKVYRFWEANGTAYMAMPLYKGRTLRQLRKALPATTFDDAWMRALIEPLLGALEVMHDADVYHRDIAPDNILWCDDGRPVLLDFGAARLVLADRTQNVTAILKPQFAPIEQYAETQAMRQGPWTDFYALAGTCFFMLTGRAPLPATARVLGDEQESLMRLLPPGCSPRLLQVLDWAMAVRPQDRPQSVAQFRDALAGRIAPPPRSVGVGAGTVHGTSAKGAASPAAYEKTIQVTKHTKSARPAPDSRLRETSAGGPATRAPHEDELERPERSVMLPPKSHSPLKSLLVLLVLAGVAGAAWTTRAQWMPMVGLQDYAPPIAATAPPPEPAASAVAAQATPASAAVADAAASATPPATQDAAASAPPVTASDAAAAAPMQPVAQAPAPAQEAAPAPAAEAAPPRAAHAKPAATHAAAKAAATRPPTFVLPPPVLPPTNEAQVGARPPPAAKPSGDQPDPAAVAATAAPAAPTPQRALGPREACADQGDAARIAACVKQLCDNEPRYQRYPVCQRVHRKEEAQQERGANE